APAGPLTEYQLGLNDGRFEPVDGDRKEDLYLIAVCADGPIDLPGNSLLLDTAAGETGDGDFHGHLSTLFWDVGGGYRAEDSRSARLPPGPGRFRLTFPVGRAGVLSARWDPLELRTCRVRLDAVEWEDASGAVSRADPAALRSNGDPCGGGGVSFGTLDPMVFLPASGDVARVTLVGGRKGVG